MDHPTLAIAAKSVTFGAVMRTTTTTPGRPNILFLMTDQMQGRVFEPGHPCLTPNIDRLMACGLRVTRAYTPNAICSPARASLMTGLLPHNHGVLTCTHTAADDQASLRTEHPHWAQRLAAAGYRTGYFGKWHVERTGRLEDFGWQDYCEQWSQPYKAWMAQRGIGYGHGDCSLACHLENDGYKPGLLYAVTERPIEHHPMGVVCAMAREWLAPQLDGDQPWCCMVSLSEPHDPFVCGREAYEKYDVEAIELPANFADTNADKPGLYRRAARIFAQMTDRQKREAMACYWASITELDEQFGRLIAQVEAAGQLDNTIVVLTSDHGEDLGAHGLYMKNIGAFEETYHIPMVFAGSGIPGGATTTARIGLHDLCPTLCDLAGAVPIDNTDSRSAAALLREPAAHEADWRQGFAEYDGTRHALGQRVVWDGPWKLVYNRFDEDELYNLDEDPQELRNLAGDPAYEDQHRRMMKLVWAYLKRTDDKVLHASGYPILRTAIVGPEG